MIKTAIIGATGYVGEELIRILLQHPKVHVKIATSQSYVGQSLDSIYGHFREKCSLICEDEDWEKIADEVDVLFLALPHGLASYKVTDALLKKAKVIDLGADYRLKDVSIYEDWYKTEHGTPHLIKKSVYGLCEWEREAIKKANLIANPGCYTTCSILSLAPLIKEDLIQEESIIIDAKSGVTGAGRSLSIGTHFTECNESIKAYQIAVHRHTPEIEEQLGKVGGKAIQLTFIPHLIPMNRGILTTAYASIKPGVTKEQVQVAYEKYYKDEGFIRLLPEGIYPETKWVKGSNYCDIGFSLDQRTGRIVIIGAIDNLIKGAAGQAVQNMNLIFGLPETMGLETVPIFPI
ncbi:MAG: N-acetyl-gamma-glutamyl-phosphate reductase [Epulopiscium sp.]|nr:N-acetyl-gamma-glutamyl-phosphate reductase [Candidatus Epulonipiscium sp.]